MDRETLQELIDCLDFIVTVQNENFEIIMQNRKAEEFFGEIEGSKCYYVFHRLNYAPDSCRILAAMRGDTSWEEFYEPSLGLWLRAKSHQINVEGERVFLHFVDDISDIKQREQELARVNELLRLATRVMRHDVVNALTAALAHIELARSGEGKVERHLAEAEGKISVAVRILKHTRELSGVEVELKPYSLKDVIETLRHGYRVEIELSGDCEVMADDGIFSIFDNLIRNAIDHGKARKITIRAEIAGDSCRVRFADDGKGIDPAVGKRIFEDGFTTSSSHTGMGLFISKLLMERYGGSISLGKPDEGEGAVFLLSFRYKK